MCVCMHMCVYVYVCICVYVRMYVSVCMCMCVYFFSYFLVSVEGKGIPAGGLVKPRQNGIVWAFLQWALFWSAGSTAVVIVIPRPSVLLSLTAKRLGVRVRNLSPFGGPLRVTFVFFPYVDTRAKEHTRAQTYSHCFVWFFFFFIKNWLQARI